MRSFKFKLIAYFSVVALAPVCGAFFGFDALGRRYESQKIDSRLRGDLRSAIAGYSQQLDAAERRASPVPLDLVVQRLRAGVDPRDRLVAVLAGYVVAGVPTNPALLLSPGVPAEAVLDGTRYRGLVSSKLSAAGNVQFAVLAPQHELVAAQSELRWRIAGALLAAVLVFGSLVYMLGLSIVRTLGRFANAADAIARGRFRERVPVIGNDEFAEVAGAFNRMAAQLEQRLIELEDERRRTREVTEHFGKALTATHDVDLLLRVIVETAVEATSASGGVVLGRDGELAHAGDRAAGVDRIDIPLTVGEEPFGRLVLSGAAFDEEQIATAVALAAQAVVALENARLHQIVERQALIDTLTGLANRRSLEESLQEEVARAERFGSDVCLVLADLDRFKKINDRFGHPTGDDALRVFAQTLREVGRDIDSVGRWGGEEFALILPGTDAAGGAIVAERVRETLATREIRAHNGELVHLTASFGVAALADSGKLESLVAAADEALYWAKREGRDRVATSAQAATG